MEAGISENRGQGHNFAVLPATYRLHWYEFQSVLGRGGFGITYLARDTNLNHRVAIKEFLPTELAVRTTDRTVHPLSDDHEELFRWGLSRFIEEAQTLARFSHPNIVPVRSVFEANNTAYMVMDYVEGVSFSRAVRSARYRSESELRNLLFQLLDGVEQIHQAGFIHRDIKPDNIFLQDNGVPVLLDFGSARQSTGGKTQTLTALVTPGYAPFEQYDTSNEADRQGPWTDIYALGALMYRTVTGKPPPDAMARMASQLDGKDILEPASTLAAADYSPRFLSAIDNALAFRPTARPQSISQWRAQFGYDDLDEEGISRARLSEDEPTVLRSRSRPAPGNEPDTTPQAPDFSLNTGVDNTGSGTTGLLLPERGRNRDTRIMPDGRQGVRADVQAEDTQPRRGRGLVVVTSVLGLFIATAVAGYFWWSTQESTGPDELEPLPAALDYRPIRTPKAFLSPQLTELRAVAADFQAILALDPANQAARDGLSELAKDFVDLAQFAQEHFSAELAANIIAEGLSVVSDSPDLLEQQASLDRAVTGVSGKPDAATRAQVEELTALAQQDLKELRLIEPPGENAVARLKAIRSLDPGNQFANDQLDRLGRYFYDAARMAFVQGDVKTGAQKLEQGLLISPAHPQLLWLREEALSRMPKAP